MANSIIHGLPHIHMFLSHGFSTHGLLGQTVTPEVKPDVATADIELLKSQLEFLKQSYSEFVETIKVIFVVFGIAGAITAYFFGKSFKDLQTFAKENIASIHDFSKTASQEAVEQVKRKAEKEVAYMVENEASDIIRAEVRNIARLLKKEQVISSTRVDYYLPGGDEEPKEVGLLRVREFDSIHFCAQIDQLEPVGSNVTVLDLVNFTVPQQGAFAQMPKEAREEIAKPIINQLLEMLLASAVLIVYVSYPPINHINVVARNRYVLAANSPITLVGNTADGAYVAKGDRRASIE